jgi:hypothetical protein
MFYLSVNLKIIAANAQPNIVPHTHPKIIDKASIIIPPLIVIITRHLSGFNIWKQDLQLNLS